MPISCPVLADIALSLPVKTLTLPAIETAGGRTQLSEISGYCHPGRLGPESDETHSERTGAGLGGGRPRHAPALGYSRSPRSQRNEIRLWEGTLWCVHRALGWPACPLVLVITCRRRGRQGHDDRSNLRTRCGSGQVSLDQEQCPPMWLLPIGSDHDCGSVARVDPKAFGR